MIARDLLCGTIVAGLILPLVMAPQTPANPAEEPAGTLGVLPTDDFDVTGDGANAAWGKTEWVTIPKRTKEGLPYTSRVKLLYSPKGLYVLFEGTDKTLTTTGRKDFENLWEEDVFEVFLWTDEKQPVYFEYEISPLGSELPILVPNFDGEYLGWRPWQYDGARKTRKATAVTGGKKEARASVAGWSAEIFIPYELLRPLKNVPPGPGTTWRANFYRVDHDEGKKTAWTWVPVEKDFHEFRKFGKLVFE
ncbi:MAG TPA: carbohydrate-binding family 9-like protein [Planctomycetaceae bacterium]|nr:carbohydrate-binding family 9-like protein [Planctomycetaceae bacterium]